MGENGDEQRKRKHYYKTERKWLQNHEAAEVDLDIILENRCSSCKEIYAQAAKLDHSIGMATVYRLVKELERIGVLSREIVYK